MPSEKTPDEALDVTRLGRNSPDNAEDDETERLPDLGGGRYVLQALVGKGGFGCVYSALDTQLQRKVAIKIPHRRAMEDEERRESWLSEARTVAQLDHPGIVPVYDTGTTPLIPCYIVSKFITGESLAAVLLRSRLSVAECVRIAIAVCDALHFAHTRGIVHRDIKPGNILLDANANPYLVDFGLALREDDPKLLTLVAGTASYMSPEQARGEGHRVDRRSDVYSLGVVLYEMLAGRKPYRASSPQEMLYEVIENEARPLRHLDDRLPREMERICSRAMAKRAGDRYSTAIELAEDLRRFQNRDSNASPDEGENSRTLIDHSFSADENESRRPKSSTVVGGGATTDVDSATDSASILIVPRGLRSFEQDDAAFFMNLVPGPRDRDGILSV